jgi:hypothetical protein
MINSEKPGKFPLGWKRREINKTIARTCPAEVGTLVACLYETPYILNGTPTLMRYRDTTIWPVLHKARLPTNIVATTLLFDDSPRGLF